MATWRTEPFQLGEWEVQPELNRLQRGAEIRQLEPKVMRVLVHLAARPGEVVSPDELIDGVWDGLAVSANVITYSIAALRKALGDKWRAPRYVETISKSGYRLVAPITGVGEVGVVGGARVAPGAPVTSLPAGEPVRLRPREAVDRYIEGRFVRHALGLVGLPVLAVIVAIAIATWPWRPAPPPVVGALQPRPVTALPGREIQPALSPDDNHVVFSWRQPGRPDYDVYVKLIGADAPVPLVANGEHDERSPAWSPDGLHVAYVRRDGGGCGIHQVPAVGGTSRWLADCPGDPIGNLAFSPDGRYLAIGSATGAGEPTRIFLMTVADQQVRQLSDPPADAQGDYYPLFSVDGREVAYIRIRADGLSDLFASPVPEGRPRRLTFDNRDIGGFDWTADGGGIIFSSYTAGRFTLWRLPAAGGDAIPVALNDHQVTSLSLSRRRGRLVYTRAVNEVSLWSAQQLDPAAAPEANPVAAGGAAPPRYDSPQPLASSTRTDTHPQLSPDARRLAFVSERSGAFELWSASLDGAEPRRHTQFGGPYVATPRWSPDGSALVFDAREDGQADLWIAPAAGGPLRRLTSTPSDEITASFSRDGAWIYFTSNRDGAWEIWRLPAAGGESVQVTRAGAYSALEGPAGRFLYYTKYAAPGIWRVPLPAEPAASGIPSGPEELVLDSVALLDWGSWTVTRRGVYFPLRDPVSYGRPVTLALLELPAARIVPLLRTAGPPPRNHPALTVSDDGRTLIWAQVDRAEADLMLAEGLQ